MQLKKKINNLLKKRFVKNVMVVASGTVMAQVISLLLMPIITRLYGPDAYGLLGTFTAITAILMPLAALTFPIAIVLPKKDAEAMSIIRLSLKIILLNVTFTSVVLLLFHEQITGLLQVESISGYLYFIPIVILLSGLFNIMTQWLIRLNQYKIIASTTIYQPIIAYGGMVMVGFFYPVASVLILFTVFKTGVSSLHMFLKMKSIKNGLDIKLSSSLLSSFKTLKKYKDFPLYRAPEVFISGVSYNIPVLLLTSLVNPAAAGFYTIGRTALAIPSRLIGKAVGDVFYPRINKAAINKESLIKLISKATIALCSIGIVPFGIVVIWGPMIFEIIFGEGWIRAGEYAQWIALMSFGTFISRPAVHTLPVINAQLFHLSFTILVTLIRVASLYYGLVILEDDLKAVALFCGTSSLLYVLLIFITFKKSKNFMLKNY